MDVEAEVTGDAATPYYQDGRFRRGAVHVAAM